MKNSTEPAGSRSMQQTRGAKNNKGISRVVDHPLMQVSQSAGFSSQKRSDNGNGSTISNPRSTKDMGGALLGCCLPSTARRTWLSAARFTQA